MHHFLPKRLMAVSSRQKASPTQQPAKPALSPAQPQSKPEPELRQRPEPTKCYPFPKRQGAEAVLIRQEKKRRGLSPAEARPPSIKSLVCLPTPHSVLGVGGTVHTVNAGPVPSTLYVVKPQGDQGRGQDRLPRLPSECHYATGLFGPAVDVPQTTDVIPDPLATKSTFPLLNSCLP